MAENNIEEQVIRFLEGKFQKDADDLVGIAKKLIMEHPNESQRQLTIRATVMMFKSKYPEQMAAHEASQKKFKETRANKFAADTVSDMRVGMRVPEGLAARINQALAMRFPDDPLFLSEEAEQLYGEWTWFGTNFKEFVAPEVV